MTTVDEIVRLLEKGTCAHEKRAECDRCTRVAAAVAEVRRLGEVERGVIHDIARLALGYEDMDDVTVQLSTDGSDGPGWYAWATEYPEEGSVFLGRDFNAIRTEQGDRGGVLR